MTSVSNNNSSPKYTATEMDNLKKEYDVNKDGVIDQKDLEELHAKGRALGAAAFIPLFGLAALPELGKNSARIGRLEQLLGKQSDKKIDSSDIKGAQGAYQDTKSCDANGTSSSNGKSAPKQDVMSELDAMRKAHDADLQKAAGQPWTCDDMARNLVNDHPEKLQGMSMQDKAFLLMMLRDSGSGKYTQVNAADCKAILTLLKSAGSPDELRKILDMAGGPEAFAKHLSGDNLAEFKKITGYTGEGAAAAPASTTNASTDTKAADKTPSSDAGGTNWSAKQKEADAQSPSSSSGKSNNETMYAELQKASKSLNDKWAEYRNVKIGDTVGDPPKKLTTKEEVADYKNQLRMEIQEASQLKSELNQFITNMLKKQHEMAMAVIRNMG